MKKISLSFAIASLFISNVYASMGDLEDESKNTARIVPMYNKVFEKIEFDIFYSPGGHYSPTGPIIALPVFPAVMSQAKYLALIQEAEKACKIQCDPVEVAEGSRDHSDRYYSKVFVFECVKRSLEHALVMVVDKSKMTIDHMGDSFCILGAFPFYIEQMIKFTDFKVTPEVESEWTFVINSIRNINDIVNACKNTYDAYKNLKSQAELVNLNEKCPAEKQIALNDLDENMRKLRSDLYRKISEFQDVKIQYLFHWPMEFSALNKSGQF